MKIARNERGFTLIELMVVLIIIGILAAIAIPVLSKQTDKARVKRAVSELKSMKTIVDVYMNDPAVNSSGNAPAATDAVLGDLLESNGVTTLTDPWDNPYRYLTPGSGTDAKTYILYSTGPKLDTAGDEITVTESANPAESVSGPHTGEPPVPAGVALDDLT